MIVGLMSYPGIDPSFNININLHRSTKVDIIRNFLFFTCKAGIFNSFPWNSHLEQKSYICDNLIINFDYKVVINVSYLHRHSWWNSVSRISPTIRILAILFTISVSPKLFRNYICCFDMSLNYFWWIWHIKFNVIF